MINLPRQQEWARTAINYYRAKVALYELMVKEWQEELDVLTAKSDDNEGDPKCSSS
jgi:hypothetical protein